MEIQGKTAAEIFESVRTLTQSLKLRSGQALPPVRDLAVQLGVNRNTVASAYRRLSMAGITVNRGRGGTVVRNQYEAGEQEGAQLDTPLVDLASGNPSSAWLPDLTTVFNSRPYRARLYGEPTVNPRLDQHIRDWVAPDCPGPVEVDLAHGAVDAIERILVSHLVAGDRVVVEDPCFLSSINALRIGGFRPVGVPVDEEGMSVQGLEEALKQDVKAIIITPRAHNPTGCSLSARRAKAISRVISKHPELLVIVDDHFALLSSVAYYSVLPPSTSRWALVRSFTKALGPDVRTAAVASDELTSRQLRLRLTSGTSWVSHLLQDMIESSITEESTMELIRRGQADYVERRKTLEAALRANNVSFLGPGDGVNLWVPLQGDDQATALALARQGWLVRPGSSFAVQAKTNGLRITISEISNEQCVRIAQIIAGQIAG